MGLNPSRFSAFGGATSGIVAKRTEHRVVGLCSAARIANDAGARPLASTYLLIDATPQRIDPRKPRAVLISEGPLARSLAPHPYPRGAGLFVGASKRSAS
jgi:hypothetical protein